MKVCGQHKCITRLGLYNSKTSGHGKWWENRVHYFGMIKVKPCAKLIYPCHHVFVNPTERTDHTCKTVGYVLRNNTWQNPGFPDLYSYHHSFIHSFSHPYVPQTCGSVWLCVGAWKEGKRESATATSPAMMIRENVQLGTGRVSTPQGRMTESRLWPHVQPIRVVIYYWRPLYPFTLMVQDIWKVNRSHFAHIVW